MNAHHQRLFDHLLKKRDSEGLVELILLCHDTTPVISTDLPKLKDAMTLLAKKPVKVAAAKTRKASNNGPDSRNSRAQEALATLLLKSPTPIHLSPRSTVIKHAVDLGLGAFVACIAKTWTPKERERFQNQLQVLGGNKAISIATAWNEDPVLSNTPCDMDTLGNHLLTRKNVDDFTFAATRKNLSWTTEDADRYWKMRFWVDWTASPAGHHLDRVLDHRLADDGVAMLFRVSQDAWTKTAIQGKFNKRIEGKLLHTIGLHLANTYPKKAFPLPLPPMEWADGYLQDFADQKNAKTVNAYSTPLEMAYVKRITSMQIETLASQTELDWARAIRLAYASYVDSRTRLNPIGHLDTRLVETVRDKMKTTPLNSRPLLSIKGQEQTRAGELLFIQATPTEQLDLLPAQLEKLYNRKYTNAQRLDTDSEWAIALFNRMEEEAKQNTGVCCRTVTDYFWNKVLTVIRQNPSKLESLMPRFLQAKSNQQAGLWDVVGLSFQDQPLDPATLHSLLPQRKMKPDVESAAKALLLQLSVSLGGRNHVATPTTPKL